MNGQAAEPPRRRSWVGFVGSLSVHALFLACVWLLAGTSVTDEPNDAGARMVRLVPGERETAPTTSGQASAVARPATAAPAKGSEPVRRVARPAAIRPVAPPPAASPAPTPLSSAPVEPEPAPAPPPAETVAAASPAVAEERMTPAQTPGASESPADLAVDSTSEDGRAAPLGAAAARPVLGRLQEVTADATVAARAQAEPFLARREVFEFLLDHLEFATHVTRALRVARYRVWRTPEGLVLDDGWGALLNLSLVQASSGARVIYARGKYRQTLLPDIRGEAVMMIEYEGTPAAGGRELVSAAVTSYVRVENAFMKLLMKMAQAAVTDKAELESRRLVRTFAKVSRAIEDNPAQVFAEVRRSPDVPQADLEAFRRLLGQ